MIAALVLGSSGFEVPCMSVEGLPMYKLVASDMDGTFPSEAHTLIPTTVAILRRMCALGVLFAPASGRPYLSVTSSLEGKEDAIEGVM